MVFGKEMGPLLLQIWLWLYLGFLGSLQAMKEQFWDRHRKPQNLRRGEGRNVVITGGNRGIGLEAVKVFLSLGYHVIIGCRDPIGCDENLEEIRKQQQLKGTHECLSLELDCLKSVRNFAAQIVRKNIPIHVLANNAGIMFGPRRETKEGFESQFATNYLGHFLLTSLLLKRLKEGGTNDVKARILNVSSVAHFAGSWMDLKDLQSKTFYSPQGAYGNSKAAQVMFAQYLTAKLGDEANVVINSAHPDVVNTGLYQHAKFIPLLANRFMKSPREGADAIVHGCISADVEGVSGAYFDNTRQMVTSSFTRELYKQTMLWFASLELVGVKEFGEHGDHEQYE